MSAKLLVTHAFALRSRSLYVLAGDIEDGVISAGMRIVLPSDFGFQQPLLIHSIESLLVSNVPPEEHVALTIECAGDLELERLLSLDLVGKSVTLTE